MKRCNCTFNKLVKLGFRPIDHAGTCPLSKIYQGKRFPLPKGDNPILAVDRFEEERNEYFREKSR